MHAYTDLFPYLLVCRYAHIGADKLLIFSLVTVQFNLPYHSYLSILLQQSNLNQNITFYFSTCRSVWIGASNQDYLSSAMEYPSNEAIGLWLWVMEDEILGMSIWLVIVGWMETILMDIWNVKHVYLPVLLFTGCRHALIRYQRLHRRRLLLTVDWARLNIICYFQLYCVEMWKGIPFMWKGIAQCVSLIIMHVCNNLNINASLTWNR